jgi:segregation and condensation protein B
LSNGLQSSNSSLPTGEQTLQDIQESSEIRHNESESQPGDLQNSEETKPFEEGAKLAPSESADAIGEGQQEFVSQGESQAANEAQPSQESPELVSERNSRESLKQDIEALIFASDEAIPAKIILSALEQPGLTEKEIDELVQRLNREYEETGRVFRIRKIAQGYRFLTEKQFHGAIQKLLQPKLQRKLSQAALETLAIVAYKQPISKTEIESIRGTSADYVVRILLEKNLIQVSGRADTIGKPLLYGTTKEFLDYFNLSSLADLPKPKEIQELMRESDAQEMLRAELKDRLTLEIEGDAEADKVDDKTDQLRPE